MSQTDRRVLKTKRALASALLVLLEKQDFQSITVNDLCAEAMVSRSTFYAHFEDKYFLLLFCVEMIGHRIFDEEPAASMAEQLERVLEGVKANVKAVKNLMMANLDAELYETLLKSFHARVEKALEGRQTSEPEIPLEIVTSFYASGITSAIMLWIRQNMECPADRMARYLMTLLPWE